MIHAPGIGTVAIAGFGTIGQRWAAAFAHAGLVVRAFDPQPTQWDVFKAIKPGLMTDLEALHGPAPAKGDISFSTDPAAALQGADFVQECGPEQLSLKQRLLATIETHAGPDTIIASSSSALKVSDMQAACARPHRVILGHPFNPAHLMPLVEIAGGDKTDPAAIATARGFYESIGKKPVVMTREITGHLALRLMAAMWREAIALARDGVASVEDIDRAFIYGPGPKWTLQGSFISNALNAEGMDAFLAKYGPTYQAIWDDLGTARLDQTTRAAVSASTRQAVGGRTTDELRHARDDGLIDMLRLLARKAAL
jgi:carnitine 3-dehydrogenase